MKKLYFLLSATLISLSASAQDANLEILHNIQTGDTIKINLVTPTQYALAYGFVNYGPTALIATDTIYLKTPYQNYFTLSLPVTGVPVNDTVYFLDTVGFGTGPATGPGQWCDSIWARHAGGAIIPDLVMGNNKECTNIYFLNQTLSVSETLGKGRSNSIGSLNIYPNPAVSTISFDYNLPVTMPVSVTVYDITGRKVYTEDLGQQYGVQKKTINVENLTGGIYMIELIANGEKQVGRVLVQK